MSSPTSRPTTWTGSHTPTATTTGGRSRRDHHHLITAPACNVGGWYDLFLGGTLDNYTGMRARVAPPRARALQRLVIGPWSHSVHGAFVGRDYGAFSGADGLDLTAGVIATTGPEELVTAVTMVHHDRGHLAGDLADHRPRLIPTGRAKGPTRCGRGPRGSGTP